MTKKVFHCLQCGECCRNIHLVESLKDFHNGDGVCIYLDEETNLCRIYENRPLVCNVEASYKVFFSSVMGWEEYLKINYEGCEILCQKKRKQIETKDSL